jgi:ribosome biogenesis GTPase / thiamine phosphate phosphatase
VPKPTDQERTELKPDIFDLAGIGMSDDVIAAFQPYQQKGLTLGRVSAVHREQYRVYTADGEVRAEAIGALLFRANSPTDLPATGDWVAMQGAMVHAVLPRRTVFSRRAAGNREEEQVMAANIDLIFVVCGLDGDFNLRRIERYLTLARESGADAAVVLNKSDLPADPSAHVDATRLIAGGAPVLTISAMSDASVDPLRRLIGTTRTAALTGSSGVGKSTILNRLLGETRQPVQEVRESDSKGRHTTTHRELFPLPGGGALIDSPGMRELQLWGGPASLDSSFEDIAELAAQCRFRDCTHTVETGCAVRETADPSRLESYRKLRAEIAWHERKENIHAAQATKQKWKVIHKAMRAGKQRFPDK